MTRLSCNRSPLLISHKSLFTRYFHRFVSQMLLSSLGFFLMGEALAANGAATYASPNAGSKLSQSLPLIAAAPIDAGTEVASSFVSPVNGKVNIRFINETGAAINYEVIGETQYRTLAGRSQMLLENLPVPTTFTFRRADFGLLQVTLQGNVPDSGTLTVRVRETVDFATDRTTIHVNSSGGVFLN